MMIAPLVAFLLATIPPKSAARKVETIPVTTSVCELTADPAKFNGKVVKFSAQFETDYVERSLLIDKSCVQLGGLLPDVPADTPGGKALDDAMAAARPSSTLEKTITATFIGTFHYSAKPEMCMFMDKEICRRYVTVTQIRDLVLLIKQKR